MTVVKEGTENYPLFDRYIVCPWCGFKEEECAYDPEMPSSSKDYICPVCGNRYAYESIPIPRYKMWRIENNRP